VAEVVTRLHQCGMQVHVLTPQGRDVVHGSGAYLCLDQRPWEEIENLRRTAASASKWVGVVHVDRCPNEETAEANLPDWGPHGAQVGGVMLFGDADLLRRVVKALED
jgi:hypothetical protein